METLAAARAPLTGSMLGRYLLGARLGVGGAASVYLALLRGPHDFERVLAIKVVHEHLTEAPDFVNMFLDEANLAVQLVHPGIVHTYELGRDGQHLFIAMEYLAGQPLSKLLERAKERGEALSPALVAWIGARAAEALAYAHGVADENGEPLGLVHRDVSPQNLFLTYDGRVLLIDFGIARVGRRLTQTGIGRIKGKFRYMAPEQMLRETVDGRADIFALGTTLYEAATGERPFAADDEATALANLLEESAPPPDTKIPGFPAGLAGVLLHALEREPKDRHPDAGVLAVELDREAAALGGADGKGTLAALMGRLFGKERERHATAVAALKATAGSSRTASAAGPTITADAIASTIRPQPEAPRRRWVSPAIVAGLVAIVAGLVAIVAGFVGVSQRRSEALAESEAAATATLEVQVEPAVDATVRVDGKTATGRRPRVVLSRRGTSLEVVVTAEGFEPTTLHAVPDRDQLLSVHLQHARGADAPGVAATAGAAVAPSPAGPSGPVAQTPARPTPRDGRTTDPARKAAPGHGSSKKDSLVTEYPF